MKKEKGILQMQVLKSIEDKFELLSLRVKVELFLFPLLIIGVLTFFLLEEKESFTSSIPIKKIDIKNIKMKESIVDVLKDIEKYAFENEIDLYLLKKGNSNIKVEVFSSLKKRVVFLKYIEELNSFSKIKSFEFFENNLIVEIDFRHFYKKEKFVLDKEFELLNEKESKRNLSLQAIVGNKALINSKWLRVDETIDSFVIKRIEHNMVFLENRFKKLTLKLYKHENL